MRNECVECGIYRAEFWVCDECVAGQDRARQALMKFLLAQIAEDEAEARSAAHPISGRDDLWTLRGPFDPDYVLAECKAKRELLTGDSAITFAERQGRGPSELHEYVMRTLALPYADREGYREDWKP